MAAVTYTLINSGNQTITVNGFTFVNPTGILHTADLSNLGQSSTVTSTNVTLSSPYTLTTQEPVTFKVDYSNYGITKGSILPGNIYVTGSNGTLAKIQTTITVGQPYAISVDPTTASWTGAAIPGASIYKDPIFKSWTTKGNYTFELPSNYTKLTVWAIGGGGGGGASANGYVQGASGAGGGGGGGTSKNTWRVKGGSTVVVVVGGGGAGGLLTSAGPQAGTPGSDSTVNYGSYSILGPGGAGGSSNPSSVSGTGAGGAGGTTTGSGTDALITGGAGGSGGISATSNALGSSVGSDGGAPFLINLLGYSTNISVGGGGGGGGYGSGGAGGGTAGAGAKGPWQSNSGTNNGGNGVSPGDGGGGASSFFAPKGAYLSGVGGYGKDGAVYILAE